MPRTSKRPKLALIADRPTTNGAYALHLSDKIRMEGGTLRDQVIEVVRFIRTDKNSFKGWCVNVELRTDRYDEILACFPYGFFVSRQEVTDRDFHQSKLSVIKTNVSSWLDIDLDYGHGTTSLEVVFTA